MNAQFLLYTLKRFGMALLTIFLVISITFFVMHAIPASPFSSEKAKSDETIAALEAEFFAQRNYGDELMQARLTELFILVARSLQGDAPSPLPRETADRLRSLRAEMLLHPERPWTSQDMARHINLSVPRLYPLYRQMFSVSPNRDLILIRIEKGRNMLRQGESVSSVAEQLGYANVTHFIRQYTQIVGVSPSRSR